MPNLFGDFGVCLKLPDLLYFSFGIIREHIMIIDHQKKKTRQHIAQPSDVIYL